jgi:hypothetical protein
MTAIRRRGNGWTTAMRWVARLLAMAAAGLFVLFAVECGPTALASLSWSSPQGIPLLLALLVSLAGLLIAWRWELVGGAMAVGGAVAIVALVCAGSGWELLRCALVFAAPLLLAGALYLGCSWRNGATVANGV